ncbi:MAG: hypothetical protein IPL11_11745 [Candidatus Accumulibacter sp.]|nr:hypothetical protein [Accumulibacter sp.]
MKVADYSYYQSMLSQEGSLQSFDSVLRNASPGFLDYLAINASQAWEGISGISNALVDAFEAGAGSIGAIYNAVSATVNPTAIFF